MLSTGDFDLVDAKGSINSFRLAGLPKVLGGTAKAPAHVRETSESLILSRSNSRVRWSSPGGLYPFQIHFTGH